MSRHCRRYKPETHIEDRHTPHYKAWKSAVLKRDGFKCQMPGCTVKTKTCLQAHHIIRWADAPLLRYRVENGITLCIKHHKQVNKNEYLYVMMFKRIIQCSK